MLPYEYQVKCSGKKLNSKQVEFDFLEMILQPPNSWATTPSNALTPSAAHHSLAPAWRNTHS